MANYRVLHVCSYLQGNEGITDYLITLTKSLLDNNIDVAFAGNMQQPEVGCSYADKAQWYKSLDINYYPTYFENFRTQKTSSITRTYKSFRQVRNAAIDFKADIIHAHSLSTCPVVYLTSKLLNIPFITTCHAQPTVYDQRLKYTKILFKGLSGFLGKQLVVLSNEGKTGFEQHLDFPEAKISLIYTGIDTNFFRPPSVEEKIRAREYFGVPENAIVICDISSFSPRKAHEVLVKAFSQSQVCKDKAVCLFAGVGREEKRIKLMVSNAGIEKSFRFLGYTDSRQVFWASDILVLPSYREAFPLVIPEAMSCGVIPVRTPAGGATHQIEDGIDGYLFPFDDDQSLMSILDNLINNPDSIRSISRKARESALNKFAKERMINSYLELYEKFI
jgi:glycosyltransferase involved in cell wall biosynthesis